MNDNNAFLLNSRNIYNYLVEHKLCKPEELSFAEIESKSCKNFNLLVHFSDDRHLLVKQESRNSEGKTNGELLHEWQIYKLLQQFPELSRIRSLISEATFFDSEHSIIVFNYLTDYCDLGDFYEERNIFPTEIATTIGTTLATIHRSTAQRQQYEDFFLQNSEEVDRVPDLLHGLERVTPEVFGQVCADGIKFFELYQRYDSLGRAIAELNATFKPCCLTHNDLKLDNILLQNEWEQAFAKAESSNSVQGIVRLIDWEKWSWGDPLYDLGTLIANYLKLWLNSLVISTEIDITTALRLATTPLEQIQPSIVALTKAYFNAFPEIIEQHPDALKRVVQFIGFALIEKIQVKLYYQLPFNNIGICTLQVAKTLLCEPEQSVPIIFGTTASDLIGSYHVLI